MANLIAELKRRNVFRVGIAFVVVGWLLIQIGGEIFPTFGAPEWVAKAFIALIALGFPVAILFAWAFEITPAGLKKSVEVERETSVTAETGRKLDRTIIGALVLLVGFLLYDRFAGGPGEIAAGSGETAAPSSQGVARASIAVLPFVNMSNDPDQEFFSDGISEEILNVLAKMPGLHVTSRSSAFQFKGDDIDIPTVARQLNVAHILEGSVRKSGTRVRITAQLIDAVTDKHMWSQTFDRELDDIFAIQDEISAAIAAALKVHLVAAGPDDTAAPDGGGADTVTAVLVPKVARAVSPEAYEKFLLARHLIARRTKAALEGAMRNLESVIAADPEYAPAWAALGEAVLLLEDDPCCYGDLSREEVIARAQPALDRALEIDPELADAWAPLGLLLDNKGETQAALRAINRAIEINPNMARAYTWKASISRDIEEQFEAEIRALDLDPLNLVANFNMGRALAERGRFDDGRKTLQKFEDLYQGRAAVLLGEIKWMEGKRAQAEAMYLRALDAQPDDPRARQFTGFLLLELGLATVAEPLIGDWAYIAKWASGDVDEALGMARDEFLANPDRLDAAVGFAEALLRTGDNAGALRQYERVFELDPEREQTTRGPDEGFTLAHLRGVAGDKAGAADMLGRVRAEIDRRLAAGIVTFDNRISHSRTLAAEGKTDEALSQFNLAVERGWLSWPNSPYLLPSSFVSDPRFEAVLAQIETNRAKARSATAVLLCAPDSDLPDSDIRAAICAALTGL